MQARRALCLVLDCILGWSTHFGFGQTWLQILALCSSLAFCAQTRPLSCGSHLDHGAKMSLFVEVVAGINGNNKHFFICRMRRVVLTSGQLKE